MKRLKSDGKIKLPSLKDMKVFQKQEDQKNEEEKSNNKQR